MDGYLIHEGVGHTRGGHSGRYPWGSGKNPHQHGDTFYTGVNKLRQKGMNDTDIAKLCGMSTTEFRKQYSLAKDEFKAERRAAN